MKKVGIITFHCSYNYGSVLQTYALQEYIKSMGYDVQVIDFVSKIDFEQYRLFRTKMYKKKKQLLIADLIFLLPRIKRKKAFEKFLEDRISLTEKRYYNVSELAELNEDIDIFVCGSDQIWNIDCTKGIEPAFFLQFADDHKNKVAYAPSLAHVEFAINVKQELKVLIERLNSVSVREESTLPYLYSFCQKDIRVTLDPTLLLDKASYMSLISKNSMAEKYIFVYILEENVEILSYCKQIHKLKGYKLYYVSSKVYPGIKNGKNLFGVSPEEFLYYISGAEYVITNSFHATVFSILFEKQFCTFATRKSAARMKDLLDKLSLENRMYNEEFDIDTRIEYEDVKLQLETLRKDSYMFLKKSLEVDINQ